MTDAIVVITEAQIETVCETARSFGMDPKRMARDGLTATTYRRFADPKINAEGDLLYEVMLLPEGFWDKFRELSEEAQEV